MEVTPPNVRPACAWCIRSDDDSNVVVVMNFDIVESVVNDEEEPLIIVALLLRFLFIYILLSSGAMVLLFEGYAVVVVILGEIVFIISYHIIVSHFTFAIDHMHLYINNTSLNKIVAQFQPLIE